MIMGVVSIYYCLRVLMLAKIPVLAKIAKFSTAINSVLKVSFSRRFSVKLMYTFNSAAIFYPGHPYIESTTVLSDISHDDHRDHIRIFLVLKQLLRKAPFILGRKCFGPLMNKGRQGMFLHCLF